MTKQDSSQSSLSVESQDNKHNDSLLWQIGSLLKLVQDRNNACYKASVTWFTGTFKNTAALRQSQGRCRGVWEWFCHDKSLRSHHCYKHNHTLLMLLIISTASSYLQSCFTRVADMTSRKRLRSSSSHHLAVLRMRLSTVGKRAFLVSGAPVWNDLPPHVISAVTRDFQTAPQVVLVLSVLFEHSYLTHIAYYYPFIFVDLAIIDII